MILRHVDLVVQEKQGRFRVLRPEGAPRPRPYPGKRRHAHFELTADEAERAAVRELRKHLFWYTRGRRGGLALRRLAPDLHTAADVRAPLDRFSRGRLDPAEVRDEPIQGPLTADD